MQTVSNFSGDNFVETPNDFTTNCNKEVSHVSKTEECKRLCIKIMELIETPKVEELMLDTVLSSLNTLVAGMQGAVNVKTDPLRIDPHSYVPPNKKIEAQIQFFQTSKKRKRNISFSNSNKRLRVSNSENIDEPILNSNIKQSDSISGENKSCLHVSNSVFSRLKEDKFCNSDNTILKMDNCTISFYMLKSLAPYITLEEEKQMKTVSPDFRKGWLYDTIADSFLFKLTENSTDFKVIGSLDSYIFQSGRNILNFSWINDVLKTNFLLIPVNINCHWTLIIADVKCRTFEYYDPLDLLSSQKPIRVFRCPCLFSYQSQKTFQFQSSFHRNKSPHPNNCLNDLLFVKSSIETMGVVFTAPMIN
ncbi:ULP_PROTEASE domain-containing protein [Caerostris extrusa]|uniref:ULP_PROTEASE domain-containing protein n=1 Tax=Caerostris extrusa TaxID=172846 RepID=A0AAV4PLK8_CAEEX|nr:ULP_PROTEASE domain-containing protein [Caerostris extrusa]